MIPSTEEVVFMEGNKVKSGGEHLRVELFGSIEPLHSAAFNHQLQNQLSEFDKLYAINDGAIGSPGHQFDRMEFARIVAHALIDDKSNDSNIPITSMQTKTKFQCSSINCKMEITTDSKFGNDAAPVTSLPFYEPN